MVTLINTKAKYVVLIESLREMISILDLIKEINKFQLTTYMSKSEVKCMVFEDNTETLKLTMAPKICPHTQHINNKQCHFCLAVQTGRITVRFVDTKEQLANMFTKVLDQNAFLYLHKNLFICDSP